MAVTLNFGVPTGDASAVTLMPKLAYRFRVTFTNLGTNESPTAVTRNVISVTRPSLTHEEVTVDTYNSKIYLAGKHTWEPITLVLRDDIDSKTIKQLGDQLNKQVNHNDQSSARAGVDYKFGMTIEMLDGSNDDQGNTNVLEKWDLAGCFIPNIQYGDLNYGESSMVQVTVQIRYDNASNHIGPDGADILSKEITGGGTASASSSDNGI